MEMENSRRRRQLRNDDTEVLAAPPLRRRARFAVSTARREIHGDPLHRTALPPTLQGFFHGREVDDMPRQEFGQFASLLRTPAAPAIDPSFSFLTKVLPWTDHIFPLDSCNGLLLFGHLAPDSDDTPPELGYIVCNPATEQWVAVPGCGCDVGDDLGFIMLTTHVSLLFDPARSSHFHLVLFWDDLDIIDGTTLTTTVHTYSSRAGVWSHSEDDDWSEEERQGPLEGWRRRNMLTDCSSLCGSSRALVDGLLYLTLGRNWILQVDAQGKTRRIVPAPSVHADSETHVLFVGQSQGLLHCIVEEGFPALLASDDPRMRWSYGLSVWVLQGPDTQQWTFKHRISNLQLFGNRSYRNMLDYHVVTMHPDCNLIFFVQHRDAWMISYDIDRQEVRALQSFQHDFGPITLLDPITLTPYVPYLSELFLGVIGAHKQAVEVL
ncbi:hypothetical protein C2845_PM03G22090 [Panicum miliaceum]|uniref:DUF1618 domain-containing protein n=1 Tax=Panicum miliaceum TaxID=4540 RepID=A0A3L6TDW8_PANMI|nr:hypothetical protein C2845_PM03G22090 [Panicum miliaceum]